MNCFGIFLEVLYDLMHSVSIVYIAQPIKKVTRKSEKHLKLIQLMSYMSLTNAWSQE